MKFTPYPKTPWKGTLAPVNPAECTHIPGLGLRGQEANGTLDQLAIVARRHNEAGAVPPPQMRGSPQMPEGARQYQTDGVAWLAGHLEAEGGAILADDMGLGKTLQTLFTWHTLRRPYPLLILCPASVRRTWRAQFERWLPDVKPLLVEKAKDLAKVQKMSPVVVTSYEMVRKLPSQFVPHMIVFDEAHKLRSRGAKTSLHIRELAPVARYKLALTGTPMWGYPRDLWNLLQALFGYRFGTADAFDYAYCGAFVNKWGGKENKGATRSDELKLRLDHVMLRRTKADVKAELPAMTREVRYVEPVKEASTMMKRAALKQCSLMDALGATLAAKIQPVVDAVLSTVNAFVVTWRKEDVRAIREALEAEGRKVVSITGDDSHAAREAAAAEAARLKCDVVATIDSTGTGVDGLQHVTSNGFFHALDYTPIKTLQCEARLHRGGQQEPVTWTYFVMQDSADEIVKQTVLDKLEMYEKTMGKDDAANMHGALAAEMDADAEAAALKALYERMEG